MAVWPNGSRTKPAVSSPYGYSPGYVGFHHGLDTYGHYNNCAIAAGQVIYIGWNTFGGGGREVWYRVGQDVIVYYHNAINLLVKDQQWVTEGQPLGIQSNTGAAKGVHCHTEVWLNGRRDSRTDPEAYIAELVGSTQAGGGTTPFPIPKEEEQDMELIYIRAANGTVVDTGVKGVIGDINVKFTSPENRAHFFALWGTAEKPRNERVHISYHNVQVGDVQAIFDMHIPSSDLQVRNLVIPPATGGSGDDTKVLAAIAKIPTAEQNGAAARAAIVKS